MSASPHRPLPHGAVTGRWHCRLDDGRVECTLCPRRCRLKDEQRGFCFVRQRLGDDIVLTSYGRASGFCIDPIEKKPLNHFFPGSRVLSFGTAGCNLGCKFCQNWDLSKARDADRLATTCDPESIAETARAWGCRSVAFTYNDPVIFAELAIDTARACRAVGLASVAVTAGYIDGQARRDFFGAMDAANVDLKSFNSEFYRSLCAARLEPVLDTLRYLKHETDVWLEVTTLLIPGHNDSDDEIARLSEFVLRELGPDVPLHFTAFHPDYQLRDRERTPARTCILARDRAREIGLRYVYTGNISDLCGQSTRCASCSAPLIERDGYAILGWHLVGDRCSECTAALPGRFAPDGPGRFGARRIAVQVPSAPLQAGAK